MKKNWEQNMANELSGPVLFNYIWWILREAQQKNIRTLYFLARDGYILRDIAERFCEKFKIDIKCKYIYCSRAALRMPIYHLIGEEAYDLLLLGGYRVTLKSYLQRLELNDAERKRVYVDCGLEKIDEDRALGRSEQRMVREKLKRSICYRMLMEEKSKAAYPSAIGYLKQEGLFDHESLAIVDSGWTGSMQRSLRQLLQSAGYQGRLTGFYFGMYKEAKSPEDGTYLTWYFTHSKDAWKKILFSNNLFECILSAPHGMTVGYATCADNNRYIPILLESISSKNEVWITNQINAILHYTNKRLEKIRFEDFDEEAALKNTRKRISRYMVHPTREEAEYYGRVVFCDDITEAYYFRLAEEKQTYMLKNYLILTRMWQRMFKKRRGQQEELFWLYGSIAFLPSWKQHWYRLNVYIWEWVRYALC